MRRRARLMERLIRIRLLLAASALALTASPAVAQVKPGEPPITAITQSSGGPIGPECAALRLEHVDLAIEVFPDTQTLQGVAALTLVTSAPQRRLLIDL